MSIDDMAKEDGRATKEMTGSLVIMSQNTETNGKHLLQISNAAKQDGEKMKIMTILTIIFLPFTFVAVGLHFCRF
jgi:Mg2+ and Co2+ transporter CorA